MIVPSSLGTYIQGQYLTEIAVICPRFDSVSDCMRMLASCQLYRDVTSRVRHSFYAHDPARDRYLRVKGDTAYLSPSDALIQYWHAVETLMEEVQPSLLQIWRFSGWVFTVLDVHHKHETNPCPIRRLFKISDLHDDTDVLARFRTPLQSFASYVPGSKRDQQRLSQLSLDKAGCAVLKEIP